MRYLVSILLLAVACTNTPEVMVSTDSDSAGGVHAGAKDTILYSSIGLQNGCYQMVLKEDTATLRLTLKDTTVSGTLVYHWRQKARDTGSIRGVLRDSLLVADYMFTSGDTISIREVIFRLHGQSLVQAFGELGEQNGKIIFTDKTRLQFMQANPFLRINCMQTGE